jgi:hypothetical protein
MIHDQTFHTDPERCPYPILADAFVPRTGLCKGHDDPCADCPHEPPIADLAAVRHALQLAADTAHAAILPAIMGRKDRTPLADARHAAEEAVQNLDNYARRAYGLEPWIAAVAPLAARASEPW